MGDLKVSIPLGGLQEGDHKYNFCMGNEFFVQYEESDIQKGEVEIKVLLKKSSRIITLDLALKGEVEVICDICLEPYFQPVQFKGRLYVKYGNNIEEGNDEMIIIQESDAEIDLTRYVYESIQLSIPFQRKHENSSRGEQCDEKMIEKLKKHQTVNNGSDTDPRWDKLKNII